MFKANCDCKDFLPKYPPTDFHSPRNHHVTIHTLHNILEEKMSMHMVERHVMLLKNAIKDCENGFHLTDLRYVSRIIELLSERVEYTPEYVPYFKQFMELCGKAPLTHNTDEIFNELEHFQEYLSVIGYLTIWLTNLNLRDIVLDSIIQLLIWKKAPGERRVSVRNIQQAIEGSQLPEVIVQLIDIVHYNDYKVILNIAMLLSRVSAATCHKLLGAGAMDLLSLRMGSTSRRSLIACQPVSDIQLWVRMWALCDFTYDILWNLVSSLRWAGPEVWRRFRTPCLNAFWCMRVAIRVDIITKGRFIARNNKVALVLLCLELIPDMPFVESGMANAMTILCVATEVPPPRYSWISAIKFNNRDYYYVEFKKMLLMCLTFYDKCVGMDKLIRKNHVIPGLCELLSLEENNWLAEDRTTLAKFSLHALLVVAPHFMDLFIEHNGPVRLLIIVESFITYRKDPELMKLAIKALNKFASLKYKPYRENVKEHFGIAIMTMFCEHLLSRSSLGQYCRWYLAYSFSFLKYLHEEEPPAAETAVCLVTRYLERVLSPLPRDTCVNPYTLVAALDFLWKITSCSQRQARSFACNGGVFKLLDVMQMSQLPVQTVALGLLVDMCRDATCVPFLMSWRGGEDRSYTFYSLLAQIFINENKEIKTRSTRFEGILDSKLPLMGEKQYQETFNTNKVLSSSPSVADLLGSCRPKIYALLQLLKNRHEEVVNEVNEVFQVATARLSVKHQIIMLVAENFLVLKIYETWRELAQELIHCKMKPVTVDEQMIVILTTQLETWSKNIQAKQHEILMKINNKEILEENNLYNVLREAKIQPAYEALREMKFIARATDQMFMAKHKTLQNKEISRMVRFVKQHNCFRHRTYFQQIPTTAVFHQKFLIDYPDTDK